MYEDEANYSRDELDARFSLLAASLTEAWDTLQLSEDSGAINLVLEKIMKVFHDSQHCRRGVVRSDSADETKLWLIAHMDKFLKQMELFELTGSDQYKDLSSERKLLRATVSVPQAEPHSHSESIDSSISEKSDADNNNESESTVRIKY